MSIKYISVDVEADGPIPGEYSMVWFGAVIIEPGLNRTFEGKLAPISDRFSYEALRVSGLTRQQTEGFDHPDVVMQRFDRWVIENTASNERPVFISDNNGFDWMFVCYYLWRFAGGNPFGHSSANINWLYKGFKKDFRKSFKHLRKTYHDHNPVNDAKGNAEAFIEICKQMGVKL